MEIQVDWVTIRDSESNILMVYNRILLSHQPLHIICFMLSFSRQTDINWLLGCPNWLGHLPGLREQHPDCTAGFYFLINPYILYMFCSEFFNTNRWKLVTLLSKLTMSPSGTSRATAWLYTAGFNSIFSLTLTYHICFMLSFSRQTDITDFMDIRID